MGELARSGIQFGRKVPVEGLVECPVPRQLSEFSKKCLGAFGFATIASRIAEGESLRYEDILVLLEKAPLSVLLKLYELTGESPADPVMIPVGFLPLHQLYQQGREALWEKVSEYLEAFPFAAGKICVSIDDFLTVEECYGEVLGRWISKYPSLTPVAPSLEAVLQYLTSGGTSSNQHRIYTLERVLGQLGQIGFRDCRECSYRGGAKMLHSAGFDVSLVTGIDRFRSSPQLARELYRIQQMTQDEHLISRWSPGIYNRPGQKDPGATLDFFVLRVLVIGALAIQGVRRRWISSRYLMPETVEFVSRAGANDAVWAAIDQSSAEILKLHPIDSLSSFLDIDPACHPGL